MNDNKGRLITCISVPGNTIESIAWSNLRPRWPAKVKENIEVMPGQHICHKDPWRFIKLQITGAFKGMTLKDAAEWLRELGRDLKCQEMMSAHANRESIRGGLEEYARRLYWNVDNLFAGDGPTNSAGGWKIRKAAEVVTMVSEKRATYPIMVKDASTKQIRHLHNAKEVCAWAADMAADTENEMLKDVIRQYWEYYLDISDKPKSFL